MNRLLRASGLSLILGATSVAQAQHPNPNGKDDCLPPLPTPTVSDPSTWQSQSDLARSLLSGQGQPNLNSSSAQSQQQLFAASSSPQSFVPSFIGDQFGTNGGKLIQVQPAAFQPESFLVDLAPIYTVANSSPQGGNFGDSRIDRLVMGNHGNRAQFEVGSAFGTTFDPVVYYTSETGFAGPGNPSQPISGGFLDNPPTPTGSYFTLIPDAAINQAATSFHIGQKPGLEIRKQEFIAGYANDNNGNSGVFSSTPDASKPAQVKFVAAYATTNDPNVQNSVPVYDDKGDYLGYTEYADGTYYIQSVYEYTPGAYLFTPNEVTPEPYQVYIPFVDLAAAPGATIGRMKVAENTSPLPRDRVYVNYSYFNNTPLYQGGVNVNRVTPGIEKTFLSGLASVELRTPFATTLDSTVTDGGITNTNNTEFGNMSVFFKALLAQNDQLAFSTGLGVTVPTADDFKLQDVNGTSLLKVRNESVHLLPFVGLVYTPNDRFFAQSIFQVDVDVNGNPVSATSFANGAPTGSLTTIGRPHDRTYMYLSFNAGYWLFLDPQSDRFITGLAPTFEYHLNQSLDRGDSVYGNVDGTVWSFAAPGTLNVNNAVIGLTALIRNDATLTVGYCTPLQSSDRQFDGEFRLMFNWLFGNSKATSRAMRAAAAY